MRPAGTFIASSNSGDKLTPTIICGCACGLARAISASRVDVAEKCPENVGGMWSLATCGTYYENLRWEQLQRSVIRTTDHYVRSLWRRKLLLEARLVVSFFLFDEDS